MLNIFRIFISDFKRIKTNVVAVVIVIGLSILPCLYAWFNILSNWSPYGPDATSNIKVAVASDDKGITIDDTEFNMGETVIEGLEANTTIGWVFTDTTEEAIDGVYSGDYYAALIMPEDFTRCKNIRFVLISPEELRVPDYIVKDVLEANGIPYKETRSLEESMSELDILYMTRVQKERFFNEEDYIRLKNSYILTKEKMSLAKPDMAVLHPLPRVNEIALDVDDDPRAAYFEQVQNGVYVRMALIMTLLGLCDPKAPKEEN